MDKIKSLKEVERIDAICEEQFKDLPITEAEYQGKKVKLNDPIRGGSKTVSYTHLTLPTNSSV